MLGTQGTKSGKELPVDCTCVVEESTNDALDSFDAFCGEWRAVGFVMSELDGLAINYFSMLVRRELMLYGHEMHVLSVDIADLSCNMSVWHGLGCRSMLGLCRQGGTIKFFGDFVMFSEALAR